MEFYKILQTSSNEKDVENNYREYFNSQLKQLSKKDPNISTITSPYNTDGYLRYINKENKININCLFEFKDDIDMNNKINRTRVIIQALYYLKKFEVSGDFLTPTTVFIGDKNECFVLHTNSLSKYLTYKLDWTIAPSEAGSKNDELLKEMVQDSDLENIHIIDINENFKAMGILRYINRISTETKAKYRITPHNVQIILDTFIKKVLNDKNLSINDTVNLFIQTLVDRINNYQHPNKPNVLITKGFGEVTIKGAGYKAYINFFDTELSPSEKEILTSTQDRLIEDETRRRQGEFFTPTIWVDEAHKMVSEQFGEDWKEESVVWDCAWGTGNLTRDYKFKELYCSTLLASDIETADQAGYNPEATKFQYDFLNDGINENGEIDVVNDPKLPQGLKDAILNGKTINILINPPYAAAGERNFKKNKNGFISSTKTSILMKNDKWGKCTEQLYSQFIYKIFKLNEINKNIKISIFSPISFMESPSFIDLRKNFYQSFNFNSGFLMNSSEFANVKNWGLTFTIWDSVDNIKKDIDLVIKSQSNFGIINDVNKKKIYNIDNKLSLKKWVEPKRFKDYKDEPLLSTALNVCENNNKGKSIMGGLGFFFNHNNNVEKNSTSVALLSSTFSQPRGNVITNENFNRTVVSFTVRKCIIDVNDYTNQKDEYMAPTEEIQQTPEYIQFNNDAIVYSLFNTSSNQSSMRQVEYKDKLWDIKNEFFWMDKDEMIKLADEFKFDELYKDAKKHNDRYVYNLLKTTQLSPDAQEILEMSKELVRKSFEWRKIMHQTNPEYHLDAWDAGWYQIKKILNDHFKDDYKVFTEKYKAFEDRLRPQVYHLGFLNDDNRDYDVEYQKEIRRKKIESLPEDNLEF